MPGTRAIFPWVLTVWLATRPGWSSTSDRVPLCSLYSNAPVGTEPKFQRSTKYGNTQRPLSANRALSEFTVIFPPQVPDTPPIVIEEKGSNLLFISSIHSLLDLFPKPFIAIHFYPHPVTSPPHYSITTHPEHPCYLI